MKGNGTLRREGTHSKTSSQRKSKKFIGFSTVARGDLTASLLMGRHTEVSYRGCKHTVSKDNHWRTLVVKSRKIRL